MVLHERNIQIQEVIFENFYLLLKMKCCERAFRPNLLSISFFLIKKYFDSKIMQVNFRLKLEKVAHMIMHYIIDE